MASLRCQGNTTLASQQAVGFPLALLSAPYLLFLFFPYPTTLPSAFLFRHLFRPFYLVSLFSFLLLMSLSFISKLQGNSALTNLSPISYIKYMIVTNNHCN